MSVLTNSAFIANCISLVKETNQSDRYLPPVHANEDAFIFRGSSQRVQSLDQLVRERGLSRASFPNKATNCLS